MKLNGQLMMYKPSSTISTNEAITQDANSALISRSSDSPPSTRFRTKPVSPMCYPIASALFAAMNIDSNALYHLAPEKSSGGYIFGVNPDASDHIHIDESLVEYDNSFYIARCFEDAIQIHLAKNLDIYFSPEHFHGILHVANLPQSVISVIQGKNLNDYLAMDALIPFNLKIRKVEHWRAVNGNTCFDLHLTRAP